MSKNNSKETWIICEAISSLADRAKLDELLSLLGVELKELTPREEKKGCMINVNGQRLIIDGLEMILKKWVPS
ncbi:MAG: hypothetical protein WC460_01830 [Patescibacteria group bacterium]